MTDNDYGLYSRSTNKRPSIDPDKCDFIVLKHLAILDSKPKKGLWAVFENYCLNSGLKETTNSVLKYRIKSIKKRGPTRYKLARQEIINNDGKTFFENEYRRQRASKNPLRKITSKQLSAWVSKELNNTNSTLYTKCYKSGDWDDLLAIKPKKSWLEKKFRYRR